MLRWKNTSFGNVGTCRRVQLVLVIVSTRSPMLPPLRDIVSKIQVVTGRLHVSFIAKEFNADRYERLWDPGLNVSNHPNLDLQTHAFREVHAPINACTLFQPHQSTELIHAFCCELHGNDFGVGCFTDTRKQALRPCPPILVSKLELFTNASCLMGNQRSKTLSSMGTL